MNQLYKLDSVEQNTINKMKEAYKNIATETYNLAKIISDIEKDETYDIKTGIKGEAHAEIVESYLKITVDNIPDKIALFRNIGTQYYKKAMDYWIGAIMYALEDMEKNKPRYLEKVIVIIKINYKDKIWDVDNHFVSMIVNAIRYSRVIDDDNFKKLSYMVIGDVAKDEKYNTEIYVVNDSEFTKFYDIICDN